MKNRKLNEIKAELRAAQQLVSEDWQGEPRHFQSFQVRKGDAKRIIPELQKEFAAGFAKVAFPVFMGRNQSLSLAEACADEGVVAVQADVDSVFSDLYTSVRASIGASSTFSVHQFAMVTRFVRDVAAKHEIAELPTVTFNDPVFCKDDNAVRQATDNLITRYGGEWLLPIALQTRTTNFVLETDLACDAPVIPVFYYNANPDLAERVGPRMFQKKYIWTSIPEEGVDKKYVLSLLNQIKKTIKSKE